jgi:hypothetical protein
VWSVNSASWVTWRPMRLATHANLNSHRGLAMIKNNYAFLVLIFFVFMSGCTTATYGRKLEPVKHSPDQYTMVIATGGFSGVGVATRRLEEKEIPEFLKGHPEYKSYKILSSRFKLIPSGVTFVIQFYRE